MIKNMAMENSNGLMEENILVSGLMENKMELEFSKIKMEISKKANGSMVRE